MRRGCCGFRRSVRCRAANAADRRTVRVLFWFLILATAATTVALASHLTSGYALFVAPPYRVELSLNFLVFLLVLGFIALYGGIRLVRRAARLPSEVRALRRRQQLDRARSHQDA